MKIPFFTFLFICALFFGCKKPQNRNCFKSTGTNTSKEIALSDFERLVIHKNIECILIQDSTDKVIIHGGSNLISKVETTISDHTLTIENKNKCNFLRTYEPIKIELHFSTLSNIEYYGTHNLTNQGTLTSDYFTLTQFDGAGSVKLKMKSKMIYASIPRGFSDFTLSGETEFALLNVSENGFCNTYELNVSDFLGVISNTAAPMKVYANACTLKAETKKNGDIYFKGTPSSISSDFVSSGKLINAN